MEAEVAIAIVAFFFREIWERCLGLAYRMRVSIQFHAIMGKLSSIKDRLYPVLGSFVNTFSEK